MTVFENEQQLQQELSAKFTAGYALADIITNGEDFTDKEQNVNRSLATRKIHDSFVYCLKSFNITEVVTENVNISLNRKDRLIPDFIVYAPETQSMVIIELKNISGPTRQAGTEIGAYAAELRSLLPFLSEGEVIGVMISVEWPTLLRHYVFNEIVWLHRKLICLQPKRGSNGIELTIIEPSIITESEWPELINLQQLSGYQLCLYDYDIYKGEPYYRLGGHENQMRAALQAMAARGNLLKAHGFAFLWKQAFEFGFAPYNITLINLAPFQTGELIEERFADASDVFKSRVIEVLRDHDPDGHGNTLDTIAEVGAHILSNICSPQPEGYSNWESLKPFIFENGIAIAFVGWGLFGERFFDYLTREYHEGEFDDDYDCMNPILAINMLNMVIV